MRNTLADKMVGKTLAPHDHRTEIWGVYVIRDQIARAYRCRSWFSARISAYQYDHYPIWNGEHSGWVTDKQLHLCLGIRCSGSYYRLFLVTDRPIYTLWYVSRAYLADPAGKV
jgi:hypothetical protein